MIEKQSKCSEIRSFASAYFLLKGCFSKAASVFWVLSLLLLLPPAVASERENKLRDLEALKQEIATISLKISQQERLRNKQGKALEALEKLLAETAAENFSAQKKLQATRADIKTLLIEQKETSVEIESKSQKLGEHLRLLYQMKDQSQLALWLSSRNPVEARRTAVALRSINEHTASEIESLLQLQSHQSSLEAQLVSSQQQSASEIVLLEKTSSELSAQRAQRATLLLKLEQEIASSIQTRTQRENDRDALETLIQTLNDRLSNRFQAARQAADNYPFGSTKGKLQWPASGQQIARFGQRKPDSSRRWQGITIAADAGTTVHSIYSGTVIFADYLPAQGMLIIVDHGEGYWSLYGRNETLIRQVGDFVTTGETIATVGASGGHRSSELYLEVRKDGKPQNPVSWFSKKA